MKNILKTASMLYVAVAVIAILGMFQLFHEEAQAGPMPDCSTIEGFWCHGYCPDAHPVGVLPPNCMDDCGYVVNICTYCDDQCQGPPIDPEKF